MKHSKRVWNIFCLITALSIFFAVLTETRSNRSPFFVKPIAGKDRHMFTDVKKLPDLAFFWSINQRLSQPDSGLSESQRIRVQEEFWHLFIQTIAAEQKLENEEAPQLGHILAEHRKAIHAIFTPEQHHKFRARKAAGKAAARMIVELQAAPQSLQNTLTGTELVQLYPSDEGRISNALSHSPKIFLAQTSPSDLFECDLHQLQILRL